MTNREPFASHALFTPMAPVFPRWLEFGVLRADQTLWVGGSSGARVAPHGFTTVSNYRCTPVTHSLTNLLTCTARAILCAAKELRNQRVHPGSQSQSRSRFPHQTGWTPHSEGFLYRV